MRVEREKSATRALSLLDDGTTIAAKDHGRGNNFNLIRMVAALAVLVSHAWPELNS